MRRITIRSVSRAISRRRRTLRPNDAVRRFVPLAPRTVRPDTCPRSSSLACTPNSPTTGSASPNPTNPSRGNVSAGVAFSPNVAEVRLRRRRNSAQGCFNPGSQDQRRFNAESVGQLLRSSYVVGGYVPRVDNPWVSGPEAIERCKCWPTPPEFVWWVVMFPGLFQPWVSGPEAIERCKRWPTPSEFVRGGGYIPRVVSTLGLETRGD